MTVPRYPLVCFDLDGTLVDDTVYIWSTLHDAFRTDADARREAQEKYFAGLMSYREWFEHDLALLDRAGADREGLERVIRGLRPMRGAREMLRDLERRGHRLAVLSGSLDLVVSCLFPDVRFDHVLLNRVRFDRLGRIAGGEHTEYDLERKADGLRAICRLEGLDPSAAVFVGDNANDVWAARAAGLPIAFNCKSEELRRACRVEVLVRDLRALGPIIR